MDKAYLKHTRFCVAVGMGIPFISSGGFKSFTGQVQTHPSHSPPRSPATITPPLRQAHDELSSVTMNVVAEVGIVLLLLYYSLIIV